MKTSTALLPLALAMTLLTAGPGQAAPVLSLASTDATVPTGGEFSVSVDIADVTDLFGYNLSVSYEPAKVRFVSLSEGRFLSDVNTTFFVPGIDDGSGLVSFSGAALIGPIAGATGSGNLLSFIFAGVGPGTARFALSDVLLIDSALASLDVDTQVLDVTVIGAPTSVPEPSSLLLVSAAALLALRMKPKPMAKQAH